MNKDINPCLTCGACCSYFRVSFFWMEAERDVYSIPSDHLEQLTPHYVCMKGTQGASPRCIGLRGEVGVDAYCGIYQHRPSPCREFLPSFLDGQHQEECDKARGKFNLPPLGPQDWERS